MSILSKKTKKTPSKSRRTRRTKAQYEFNKVYNKDGGQVRKIPAIELGGEESAEGGNLVLRTRWQAIAAVRDLMRNSLLLKGDINTLQLNVIGNSADLMFYAKTEDWYRQAEKAFRRWAKHADFREGTSLVEFLDKVLYTVVCEGDVVVIFDRDLTDSGKVLMVPPDQICPLVESDFTDYSKLGWTQCDGIIRDDFGRTVGVVISPKPGQMSTSIAEGAVVLVRDDPYTPTDWVYLKRSFRDTIRGVADALPALGALADIAEVLDAERISVRRFSNQYAYVTEPEEESAVTPEGFVDPEEIAEDGEGGEGGEDKPKTYEIEHLQDVTAGMLDVLPAGGSVTFSPNDRPSPNTMAFVESNREMIGSALGLTRSYSLSKADTSYTSARWDTGVAEKQFAKLRQYLDDQLLDWLADRVIGWLVDHGKLDAPVDEDWIDSAAFEHPSGKEVLDEGKVISAQAQALRNGSTNLEQIVGANWRSVLKQLSDEKKYAESLGLNLSFNETAAGQYIPPETTETEETEE